MTFLETVSAVLVAMAIRDCILVWLAGMPAPLAQRPDFPNRRDRGGGL